MCDTKALFEIYNKIKLNWFLTQNKQINLIERICIVIILMQIIKNINNR